MSHKYKLCFTLHNIYIHVILRNIKTLGENFLNLDKSA